MPDTIRTVDRLLRCSGQPEIRGLADDLLSALAAVERYADAEGQAAVPLAMLRDLVTITARLTGRAWLEANRESTAAFAALQVMVRPPPLADLDQILASMLSDRFGLARCRPVSMGSAPPAAIPAGPPPAVIVPFPRPVNAGGEDPGMGEDLAPPSIAAGALVRYRAGERWARPQGAVITATLLWRLVDALADGIALADHLGGLVLVNRRLAEMFGYRPGELTRKPVELLIPVDRRVEHVGYRAGYQRAPRARPMDARRPLTGLRKDGSTFPVQVSLTPVQIAAGHFTLAVARDATEISASDLDRDRRLAR